MCARQCGKTWGCTGLLWLTASRTANVECLYLSLVKEQAKIIFRRYWKPMLRRWKIPAEHLESELSTTMPNGSVVRFAGVDDTAHIETLLGASRAGGIVILDECQSTPIDLQDLVTRILEPSLSQTSEDRPIPGRLVMIGTIPQVPAGYFWQIFKRGLTADGLTIDASKNDGWQRFSWNRFQNPHLLDARKHLEATLKKFDTTEANPIIQRDWHGRWVFDSQARAFHAFGARNVYTPTAPQWLATVSLPPGRLMAAVPPVDADMIGIGIDPASLQDRFAIVMWMWSTKKKMPATQVAEWITSHGADPLQSQWAEAVRLLLDKYGPNLPRYLVYDASGAQSTIDFAYRHTQLFIKPALKGPGSLKAGVDRVNDVFARRECLVMAGSALEEDLTKAKWSTREKDAGKWVWGSEHHPDAADAARYGIEPFLQSTEPDKEDLSHLSAQERTVKLATEEAARSFREMYEQPTGSGQSRPAGAASSLYRR
jgi:hypothetical protein